MKNWFKARWNAYLTSSDPEVALSGTTPAIILFAVGSISAIFLGLAYIPPLAELSKFRNLWLPMSLVAVGGMCSFTAWKHRCRGTIGSAATLLDNTIFSTAWAAAAMNTQGSISIALTVVHAITLVVFPGQAYALTFLLAVSMMLPLVVLLLVFQPPVHLAIIMVCAVLAMLAFSATTGNRREAARRQKRLEAALGAAEQLADESVQAALTTTLLTLGHFLHELRNYQTAVSTNLDFIQVKSQLPEAQAEALKDAQAAQKAQERLLHETIADLKRRAKPAPVSFMLSEVMKYAQEQAQILTVTLSNPTFDAELPGNPEHLRVVMLNLVRNAEKAGSSRIELDARLAPGGDSVHLVVHDDGPGMPKEQREKLFDSFAFSSNPGGGGLGLYLVRRYVQLLRGKVDVQESPLGGAAFHVSLPITRPHTANPFVSVA